MNDYVERRELKRLIGKHFVSGIRALDDALSLEIMKIMLRIGMKDLAELDGTRVV